MGNGFGFQAGVRGKGVTGLLDLDPFGLGLGVEAQALQQLAELTHFAGVAAGDHQGGHQIPSASWRAQLRTSATRASLGASQ